MIGQCHHTDDDLQNPTAATNQDAVQPHRANNWGRAEARLGPQSPCRRFFEFEFEFELVPTNEIV